MGNFAKDIGQTAIAFAVLFVLQWIIPYVYLVIGAGGWGLFQIVSEKKRSGWHYLVAAVVLGVNAWIYDRYFRK